MRDDIPGKMPSDPETSPSWPCHPDWPWAPEAQAVCGIVLARGFCTPGCLSQPTAYIMFSKESFPRIETPLSLTGQQAVPKTESELD